LIAPRLVPGQDYPADLGDFLRMFPDDEACRDYLFRVRWPNGFRCPRPGCTGTQAWKTARGLYVCRTCERNVSVTAGTVLDRTRTPLRTWFFTIWQLTTSKAGTSALGLYRSMGFGSQATAWTHLHKLRRAMVRQDRDPLGPELEIEVDETYVGGLDHGVQGRRQFRKAIVAIAVEVHRGRRGFGRCRLQTIEDVSRASLEPFVREYCMPGSTIVTDAWAGYGHLEELGYEHIVHHMNQLPDPAHVYMPAAHRVASLLKRWILGTHQGSVSMWQMPFYLDEFVFRFNRRNSRRRGLVFYRMLQQIVVTPPTTNEQLYRGW